MIIIKRAKTQKSPLRVERDIDIDGKNFNLFVETTDEWADYLVDERDDAFLVGILPYAMRNKQDIKIEGVITSELLYNLETYLIKSLADHDDNLWRTRIFADNTADETVENAGAVGTGLSLGVDCFNTIATMHNHKSKNLRLTHLLVFNNGAFGGYYQKTGWDYSAQKLLEREKSVAAELGLPVIEIKTNLPSLVHLNASLYHTYMMGIMVLSLAKLFKTYYYSSAGYSFSGFSVINSMKEDCGDYDLLSLNCFSANGGLRFYSSGGEKTRLEKVESFMNFPIAQRHLQSCLTEHFNCGYCQKCKRNLVTLDVLGVLDKFAKVYDVAYYKSHQKEYIEWVVKDVTCKGAHYKIHAPIYERLLKLYPEMIAEIEDNLRPEKLYMKKEESERISRIFRKCVQMYEKLSADPNGIAKIKTFFEERGYHNIIIHGNTTFTQLLFKLRGRLGIEINYVVEDTEGKRLIPRLPESTVDYPNADAFIICNIEKTDLIRRKLQERVSFPIHHITEIIK
ncbi:hypothetical protein FACS1894208_09900 [Clostridia bacterium]|nr:hypothetical protein FACS1894208_09900 [Clostridia bacterium]